MTENKNEERHFFSASEQTDQGSYHYEEYGSLSRTAEEQLKKLDENVRQAVEASGSILVN
jgi:hypothetical protein